MSIIFSSRKSSWAIVKYKYFEFSDDDYYQASLYLKRSYPLNPAENVCSERNSLFSHFLQEREALLVKL